MPTFLLLLNKLIFQNKWKVFFILAFPLFLLFVFIPFISETVEESNIPVAVVNGDKTSFSKVVTEKVGNDPKISLLNMEEQEARDALTKGDVEAVFLFEATFEEEIRDGNIREQIKWLRTEHSFLDTFVKERIASETMRLTLNSKAANDIAQLTQETDEKKWEAAFDHSESYWEPEPLFAMEFVPVTNTIEHQEDGEEHSSLSLAFLGFWFLFAWFVFGAMITGVYDWEKNGQLTRIQLLQGSKIIFYSLYYLFVGIFTVLLFIAIHAISSAVMEDYAFTKLFGLLLLLFVAFLLTILCKHLLKKKNQFLFFIAVYGMSSFTLSIFPLLTEAEAWWYYIFPHVWLYELFL